MSEDIEYHDEMIAMLEIIWGPGFMAPGGEGNIANIVTTSRICLFMAIGVSCDSSYTRAAVVACPPPPAPHWPPIYSLLSTNRSIIFSADSSIASDAPVKTRNRDSFRFGSGFKASNRSASRAERSAVSSSPHCLLHHAS